MTSEVKIINRYQQWLADAQLAQATAEIDRDEALAEVADLKGQVNNLQDQVNAMCGSAQIEQPEGTDPSGV